MVVRASPNLFATLAWRNPSRPPGGRITERVSAVGAHQRAPFSQDATYWRKDITLDGRSSDKGDWARTEIHMTEWTTDVDDGGAIDEAPMTSQPVLRKARRSALRRSSSRRELYSDARDEARLVRGRDSFVWRGRVLPVGVPIAAAAGLL